MCANINSWAVHFLISNFMFSDASFCYLQVPANKVGLHCGVIMAGICCCVVFGADNLSLQKSFSSLAALPGSLGRVNPFYSNVFIISFLLIFF